MVSPGPFLISIEIRPCSHNTGDSLQIYVPCRTVPVVILERHPGTMDEKSLGFGVAYVVNTQEHTEVLPHNRRQPKNRGPEIRRKAVFTLKEYQV